MAERPIIFSAPMVKALLAGRKTQTRRILKPYVPTPGPGYVPRGVWCPPGSPDAFMPIRWQIGDTLWVREAVCIVEGVCGDPDGICYRADDQVRGRDGAIWKCAATDLRDAVNDGWRPSIHMPRWASRLTLTVSDVRVERLRDISEEDAKAEGVETEEGYWRDYLMPSTQICVTATQSFQTLWQSINGPGSWEANPWIVALTLAPASPADDSNAKDSRP